MEKEEKAAATAQEGDFSSRLFRFLRRFISAEKTGFAIVKYVRRPGGWRTHSTLRSFLLFS